MANHLWWTKPPWRPDVPTGVPGPILSRISSLKGPGGGKTEPNLQGRLGDPARCWGTSEPTGDVRKPRSDLQSYLLQQFQSVQLRMLRPPGRPVRSATRLIATKGSHFAPLLWVDRDFSDQKTQRWFSRQRRPCDTSSHSASEPTHLPAHGYPGSKTPNMSPKGVSPPRLWTVTETSRLSNLSIVSDPDIDTYRYRRIDVESMSNRCRINVWYERGKAKQNNTEEL